MCVVNVENRMSIGPSPLAASKKYDMAWACKGSINISGATPYGICILRGTEPKTNSVSYAMLKCESNYIGHILVAVTVNLPMIRWSVGHRGCNLTLVTSRLCPNPAIFRRGCGQPRCATLSILV
jgi:hypothetical protein